MLVRWLTPELVPSLEDLFGDRGAAARCWCMYWRVGAEYRKRPAEENHSAFRRVVEDGPSPGLIALEEDLAVGWCQVTPRHAIPAIEQMWRLQREIGRAHV